MAGKVAARKFGKKLPRFFFSFSISLFPFAEEDPGGKFLAYELERTGLVGLIRVNAGRDGNGELGEFFSVALAKWPPL